MWVPSSRRIGFAVGPGDRQVGPGDGGGRAPLPNGHVRAPRCPVAPCPAQSPRPRSPAPRSPRPPPAAPHSQGSGAPQDQGGGQAEGSGGDPHGVRGRCRRRRPYIGGALHNLPAPLLNPDRPAQPSAGGAAAGAPGRGGEGEEKGGKKTAARRGAHGRRGAVGTGAAPARGRPGWAGPGRAPPQVRGAGALPAPSHQLPPCWEAPGPALFALARPRGQEPAARPVPGSPGRGGGARGRGMGGGHGPRGSRGTPGTATPPQSRGPRVAPIPAELPVPSRAVGRRPRAPRRGGAAAGDTFRGRRYPQNTLFCTYRACERGWARGGSRGLQGAARPPHARPTAPSPRAPQGAPRALPWGEHGHPRPTPAMPVLAPALGPAALAWG